MRYSYFTEILMGPLSKYWFEARKLRGFSQVGIYKGRSYENAALLFAAYRSRGALAERGCRRERLPGPGEVCHIAVAKASGDTLDSMHCMLVIPGILTRDPNLIDKLGTLALPALQRLLARGRRQTAVWQGIDAWLLEKFSVERQADWPSAPFALLGEGETPGDACWAHADPVS